MKLVKPNRTRDHVEPLESVEVVDLDRRVRRIRCWDGAGRLYADLSPVMSSARVVVRGAAGVHRVVAFDERDCEVARTHFVLRPATRIDCDGEPFGALATRLEALMREEVERNGIRTADRYVKLLISWFRDHTYVLKSYKYFTSEVRSGVEFFLDRQQPNGMFWDCVHRNTTGGFPNFLGEALGPGFFAYEEDGEWILRRIPVEADVEYIAVEAVWHAWKATGDDAWLAAQLPRLLRGLEYMMSDPQRWSAVHGLVKRGYTMDSWDFTNPRFYPGRDHRWLPGPGQPYFLFHGDNSGAYMAMCHMAEFLTALGRPEEAARWRERAEELRERANAKLWFDPCYAAMVPEEPLAEEHSELVRRDRERLSLSIGYTINRGLPTHEMAVRILREYQRRRETLAAESFAEWCSMDPPYTIDEWPDPRRVHTARGEYMNGAVSPLLGGELARAAFEHGLESYGADILRRIWDLTERDSKYLAECYYRHPQREGNTIPPPPRSFTCVDLRRFANAALSNATSFSAPVWTGEGDNDLRNLPTGHQRFCHVDFYVIPPAENQGRSAIIIGDGIPHAVGSVEIPLGGQCARSLYILHTKCRGPRHAVVATYDLLYADGTWTRLHVHDGIEIGHWWNAGPVHSADGDRWDGVPSTARVAWQGANGVFGNVGVYVFGWDLPHPERPLTSIHMRAEPDCAVAVLGLSLSDRPVQFERSIRSFGLPAAWTQSSVFHGLAEGLAGVVDTGRAFSTATVSPRWAATRARSARVTLHYPASDGYCGYRWARDDGQGLLELDLSLSGERVRVRLLLPEGTVPVECLVADRAVDFAVETIERSRYVVFDVQGPGAVCRVRYRAAGDR